jgi:putative membrane protein
MHISFATKFGLRWLVSSLGLYIASALLGSNRVDVSQNWWTVILAGLFLALINTAIKPVLIILSFPAIILSLGLFMLVINGLLILVASWLYPALFVKNLGVAILTGIIIGLVNYLVTRILEDI